MNGGRHEAGEHVRPVVGILSDDLTGANGVGAMFAGRGMRALTLLGVAADADLPDADVLVVDTATRDASPPAAAAVLRRAAERLRAEGVTFLAKRIDTTLRGPIGTEIRAVLDTLGGRVMAVVVPAAPEAGRTVRGGRVWLGGRPLSERLGIPDEPAALIREQGDVAAASVGIEIVRGGPAAVAGALGRAEDAGIPVTVWDAETVADVRAIAEGVAASGRAVVSVDPGGFTLALTDALGLVPSGSVARCATLAEPSRGKGRVLAIVGSRAAETAEQARFAAGAGLLSVTTMKAGVVFGGGERAEDEVRRAVRAAVEEPLPAAGLRVAAEPGVPEPVDGAERVAAALAQAAFHCLGHERRPDALFLTGGTVARAVLDRLGATAVAVDGAVLPLAAMARLIDGPYAGLPVVTKGGMIGGIDALVDCLRHLHRVGART